MATRSKPDPLSRHRYEVDPQYIERLEAGGLVFSGRARKHPIMQVLELPGKVHPFFLATQAHAELSSRPLNPSPMFLGLIRAALAGCGLSDPPTERNPGQPHAESSAEIARAV